MAAAAGGGRIGGMEVRSGSNRVIQAGELVCSMGIVDREGLPIVMPLDGPPSDPDTDPECFSDSDTGMFVEIIDGEHEGMLVEFHGYMGLGDSFRHPKLNGWHRIVDFDGRGRGYAEQVTPLSTLDAPATMEG